MKNHSLHQEGDSPEVRREIALFLMENGIQQPCTLSEIAEGRIAKTTQRTRSLYGRVLNTNAQN